MAGCPPAPATATVIVVAVRASNWMNETRCTLARIRSPSHMRISRIDTATRLLHLTLLTLVPLPSPSTSLLPSTSASPSIHRRSHRTAVIRRTSSRTKEGETGGWPWCTRNTTKKKINWIIAAFLLFEVLILFNVVVVRPS